MPFGLGGKDDATQATAEKDIMFTALDIIKISEGTAQIKQGLRMPEPYIFVVDTSIQAGKAQLNNLARAINILATEFGYELVTHAAVATNAQIICMRKMSQQS